MKEIKYALKQFTTMIENAKRKEKLNNITAEQYCNIRYSIKDVIVCLCDKSSKLIDAC